METIKLAKWFANFGFDETHEIYLFIYQFHDFVEEKYGEYMDSFFELQGIILGRKFPKAKRILIASRVSKYEDKEKSDSSLLKKDLLNSYMDNIYKDYDIDAEARKQCYLKRKIIKNKQNSQKKTHFMCNHINRFGSDDPLLYQKNQANFNVFGGWYPNFTKKKKKRTKRNSDSSYSQSDISSETCNIFDYQSDLSKHEDSKPHKVIFVKDNFQTTTIETTRTNIHDPNYLFQSLEQSEEMTTESLKKDDKQNTVNILKMIEKSKSKEHNVRKNSDLNIGDCTITTATNDVAVRKDNIV